MTQPESSFTIKVDVTNPGQFFACCGLLELAHRVWPDAEGWFDAANDRFAVSSGDHVAILERLFSQLRECDISGLSQQERQEREILEAESRKLRKQRKKLPLEKEELRKELGTRARAGVVRIEEPFFLILNWWQTGDDEATPKTWAGLQELHKIARATQDTLSDIAELTKPFDHDCVLRMPREYRKGKSDYNKRVEPFYFDARRFAHALDAGFSLDVQNAETIAHPAVELLCLIGLQRFRPSAASVRWSFDYHTWSRPLSAPVAAAVVNGLVPTPARRRYRFSLLFRDDQKRYKAFGFATPIGDDT